MNKLWSQIHLNKAERTPGFPGERYHSTQQIPSVTGHDLIKCDSRHLVLLNRSLTIGKGASHLVGGGTANHYAAPVFVCPLSS